MQEEEGVMVPRARMCRMMAPCACICSNTMCMHMEQHDVHAHGWSSMMCMHMEQHGTLPPHYVAVAQARGCSRVYVGGIQGFAWRSEEPRYSRTAHCVPQTRTTSSDGACVSG